MTADGGDALAVLGLTEAQEGLWYAQSLDPANPAFNTGHYLDLRGPLDVERMRRAADQAAIEAEGLALRLWRGADGTPNQAIDPARRPFLRVVDALDEAAALRVMHVDLERPLDPAADALAAQTLFRLGADRHLLFHRAHHLVLDGFGADLLIRRIAVLYGGSDGDRLPSFARAVEADAAFRTAPRRDGDAAYWRQLMQGAPAAPAGPTASGHAHRARATFPAGTGETLRRLAESADIAWPDLLTALLARYCRRLTGEAEAVVGVTFMNRFGSAAARVPATLMNVLPLRVRGDEAGPLGRALAGTLDQLAGLRRHGRFRGEQIRRDLRRAGLDQPLFGPIVNVQPFHGTPDFPGLSVELHILATGPVDDLTLDIRTDGAATALHLDVEGNPARYDAAMVAAHAERAATFITAALAAGALDGVPLVTPAEAAFAIHGANQTAHAVPETSLAALIAATMQAHPAAPAVAASGIVTSYGELDRRSAALAASLTGRGAGPGAIVAVALQRSTEMIVALLGVLRAGAAYLPLDPAHPPERVRRILDSARPVALLAETPLAEMAPFPPAEWPAEGAALACPAAHDAAYVLYTSGSTGEPKGVVVEHDAIVNRLLWMREHYGFGPADRILQKTTTTFDVSVWELFLPFLCGGTLVMAPPDAHRDPAAIAGLIRKQGVTALHFVPSMLSAFLAHPASYGLAVNRVFCSGEALTAGLRDRFHARVRGELHNLYGPTEAAVDVTFWNASAADRSAPVPIGHPVWNTRLYVLDEADRPVPPGVPGRLLIAGRQLAREYLGRPDLTARAFVPDPFYPGERMYRTGDLALRRADGAILFLGRSDGQVKLRGQRLELGEVEAALAATPGVAQVRVIAREDRPGDTRLVAYIVPGPAYDPAGIRSDVATRLPDYMVPSAFVTLPALPVNASGKLDRAALPPPATESTIARAPATATEQRLAALFAEILGVSRVDVEDDFFTLGGHSLLAVDLVLSIAREWGRDPGLGAVFANPTVARLAAHIDRDAAPPDDGLRPMLRLGPAGSSRTLFAIHPAGGIGWCYGELARALAPDIAVVAVQAPALDPAVPLHASMEALAADYADRILAVAPLGPIDLAGWSVGGIIAQAVATALSQCGRAVGMVALLDAYPADAWRAQAEPGDDAMLRALLLIAGYDPAALPELLLQRDAVIQFLRRGGSALGRLPDAVLDGIIRVVGANNRLVRHHRHSHFAGAATHFRAAHDHAGTLLSPSLWSPYVGRLEVIDVPATHGEMMGERATAVIAPALARLLVRL